MNSNAQNNTQNNVHQAAAAKRAMCPQCTRPQRTCICQWITPIQNQAEVLILQHPLEVANAKGSATLLHGSLLKSQLLVGEQFERNVLQQALQATGSPIQAVLLYPDTSDSNAVDLVENPAPVLPESLTPDHVRLVILDATWRKSRKMLYQNPLLQSLPRISLQDMPASHYRIRKAHRKDQLSTLEATIYALMRLEKNEQRYLALLNSFDGFVAQQSAYMQGHASTET
ncbi:MAG: DTW domain-containing protein [Burkholderiales bacterium]|nr:DTW domain-containing protein [Burkholderiales bacterium]